MSSREHAEAAGRPDPDVLDEVTRAIAKLESHQDPAVREAAQRLLAGIDAVHRAGLTHLVQGIHGMAGEAFLNRLLGDPAIRLLLMSYNLVAVDRRLQAEEALDQVRGHLHDHGVDVEMTEVVGGVVYVRLHASHRDAAAPPLAFDDIRRDLETALREGLLGFQELVLRDRADTSAPAATIPLAALRQANRPVHVDAGPADLCDGQLRPVRVNDVPILLVGIDGDVHAIRNQCGDGPLPLEFSTLEASVLRCSWHGCRYDVRTGKRTDHAGDPVQVYPVSIESGRIRVALGVDPAFRDAS
jgi:nitrite reductase/ring-hydroxylating ferredoxin subunit